MNLKDLKTNTTPEVTENGDANGSILIEDGRDILAERKELCELRTASFDPAAMDPAWTEFLGKCLEILERLDYGDNRNIELCKPVTRQPNKELCKPEPKPENKEVCKLQNFWLTELEALSKTAGGLDETKKLIALVPAWETTLQILLEAECAKAENVPVNEKEIRNILYSYFYDYAEELLANKSQESFLTSFLAKDYTQHVRDGLSLFFGDRLKARLLDVLQSTGTFPLDRKQPTGTLLQSTGNVPSDRKQSTGTLLQPTGNVPIDRNLTPHQEKALAEFWKKAALFMTLVLLVLCTTACGGKKSGETDGTTAQAVLEDENAYPGTVAYENPEEEINDRFGIMHATVLDVQNGEKDGLFIYTLRDREDPDNAWCLNSQDVGSIVCTVTGGKEVAVLFSGDIVSDPDSVDFIAILDDAPYTIKKAEGTTVSNMMNSFTVRTTGGVELTFIKDNCRVDRDALSTEPGSRLLIYYTDGGSVDHYPLRVYKLPSKER